jgi:DNA polymerase phi
MTLPSTLSFYWDLASTDVSKRNIAALALITTLQQFQNSYQSDPMEEMDELKASLHPDVGYALKRLTRGLSSSRDNAREGFAVCLTELYSMLSSTLVLPSQLLEILIHVTEKTKTGKAKEERECWFARVFGIQAMIASDIIKKMDLESVKLMTVQLMEASKKSFLKTCVCFVLIQLVKKLEEYGKKECAEFVIKTYLAEQDTVESVWFSLELRNKIDFEWTIVLTEWKKGNVLYSKNKTKLLAILRDATYYDTVLHPVYNSLIENLLQPETKQMDIFEFWESIEQVFFHSSHDRKSMGFQLFEIASPLLGDQVTRIMTPHFMRCMINSLSNKDTYLYKQAQHTVFF